MNINTKPSRKDIRDLLVKLHVQPGLSGHQYIEDFVMDYFDNDGQMPDITTWYDIESKRVNKVKAANIERSIRTIMQFIRDYTGSDTNTIKLINEIFVTENLTNKHFLYAICNYFRND